MKLLVGADPELFIYKNDVPVSAYGLVPGTKESPFTVNKGAVQVDGMALEFNIDPADDEESFSSNISEVMETLRGMVSGYDVKATPVAEFGMEYILEQPVEAIMLGCDPDFNAWAGGVANESPDAETPFRTGAGHVHIGWTKGKKPYDLNHRKKCINVIKQMDFFLGLPSLFFDGDNKRRMMYGKPGCFRPKSYGVEYRVLSNKWLDSKDTVKWVFRNTKEGVERLFKGEKVFNMVDKSILLNLMAEKPDLHRVDRLLEKLDIEVPEAA